jgi:hypothetical protein
VRAGLRRYYGVVHGSATVGHWDHGSAEFQRVIVPSSLRDVDAAGAANALRLSAPIFGPVPYRGGPVEIEIGLFSVRTAELVGPYLDVLLDVAGAAGPALVPGVRPVADVVVRGMRALIETDGAVSLELGLSRSFVSPSGSDHVLIKAPRGEVDVSGWFVGDDDMAYDADGVVPLGHPWLAFTLDVTSERADWHMIPALREAHANVREAVLFSRRSEARGLLEALRVTALSSPDLLPRDATKLFDTTRKLVADAFPGGPTTGRRRDIGPLESLDLYSSAPVGRTV